MIRSKIFMPGPLAGIALLLAVFAVSCSKEKVPKETAAETLSARIEQLHDSGTDLDFLKQDLYDVQDNAQEGASLTEASETMDAIEWMSTEVDSMDMDVDDVIDGELDRIESEFQ